MKKFLLTAVLICTTSISANAQDSVKSGNVSLEGILPSIESNVNLLGTQSSQGNVDYVTLPWAKGDIVFAANVRDSRVGKTTSPIDYFDAEPQTPVSPTPSSDPYMVKIENTEYLMVKDNNDGKWTENDILGYNDKIEQLFNSLINLNSDGDKTKLTAAELKSRKIRFVQISPTGELLIKNTSKDFNLDKIDYIDLVNLKTIANNSKTGIHGHFNLHLKTNNPKKKLVLGYVVFFTNQELRTLFPE